VVYWEGIAAEDTITAKGYKYLLRFAPKGSEMGEGTAKFVYDVIAPGLGIKPNELRYAVVRKDDNWGNAIGGSSAKKAKEIGLKLVADIPTTATLDFSDIVMRLKDAKPDFLYFVLYPHDAFVFLRQMRDLKVQLKAVADAGTVITVAQVRDALGDDANYMFDCSWGMGVRREFLQPSVVKDQEEFIERYKKKFGVDPTTSTGAVKAYVPTWALFKDVLPRAGSTDPDAVRKAAGELDIPDTGTSFGYGVKFNPPGHPDAGHNLRASVMAKQRFGDNLYRVYPSAGAVIEPILPMPPWGQRKFDVTKLKLK
jgi:branched-chain amino acid transport system substrate-binding protein